MKSAVMHSHAWYYDGLAWALTLGRERALRERLVDIARLAPGEVVLDAGCGTGSLAIAAKRRVGATGVVHAVDAAPEMIAKARAKAARSAVDVVLHVALAESLPFPDGHFDVVLSTLMLHHLPGPVRRAFAGEIRRVLKPGGRVLAVDFEAPARHRGLIAHVHRGHGGVPARDVAVLLEAAGLRVRETGAVGVSDLQFTLATSPREDERPQDATPPEVRSYRPLPLPWWASPIGALARLGRRLHGIEG
jgi:ubiquinone/menaquinone biosynthesis C-methylase UbiE